jgi:hypothetical protein
MSTIHETAEPVNTSAEQANTGNDAQRDEKGRFRKGNRGGPGNPFARRTARLRQVLLDAVSDEELRQVTETLKQKAVAGDVAAIKLLLSYTVGKPAEGIDPDTVDRHELQSLVDEHTVGAGLMQVIEGVPAGLLLQILTALMPVLTEMKLQQMKETLTSPVKNAVDENDDDEVDEDEADDDEDETQDEDRSARIPSWMWELVERSEQLNGVASAEEAEYAPSGNGCNGAAGPTENGRNGAAGPAGNGRNGAAGPSANGHNGAAGPSGNGRNGVPVRPETGVTEPPDRPETGITEPQILTIDN